MISDRTELTRSIVRLIASVLVCAIGLRMALGPFPVGRLPGVVLLLLGAYGAARAGSALSAALTQRSDPYDLRNLWNVKPPREEPAYDADANHDLILCHVCGHALPEAFGICPECGARLRG